MILAASNIAWAPDERLAAYNIMAAAGLTGRSCGVSCERVSAD